MVKFRMLFTIPKDIVDMGVQKGCHIQWQDIPLVIEIPVICSWK
jgi:hypothetical protein